MISFDQDSKNGFCLADDFLVEEVIERYFTTKGVWGPRGRFEALPMANYSLRVHLGLICVALRALQANPAMNGRAVKR